MAQPSRVLTLSEVGQIRGGYVGRTATSDQPGADRLRALQASDVAPDGSIAWQALQYVEPERDGDRYAVVEGDVILPLRSASLSATVARDVPPRVIAVGQWALLTPDPALADSDFLVWFLNHPATQIELGRRMQGTRLRFLSFSELRSFPIALPPLEVQRRIARVDALHRHVVELEQQLTHARKQCVDSATLAALHRAVDSNSEDA